MERRWPVPQQDRRHFPDLALQLPRFLMTPDRRQTFLTPTQQKPLEVEQAKLYLVARPSMAGRMRRDEQRLEAAC